MTMTEVRPFWGRASLVESLVDEVERPSGLVVPVQDANGEKCKRGVVREVDDAWDDAAGRAASVSKLQPGTAVYYRNGWKIGDVVVVDLIDILAYEENT